MPDLFQLSSAAHELASDLLSTEAAPCSCESSAVSSCITNEETRPLTRSEKSKGWARRPFSAYDPSKMCLACAAYWHASMCSNALHDMKVIKQRNDAERPAATNGFQVHVNKYSHEGSAFDRTEGEPHHSLAKAIEAAMKIMPHQRFAFITEVNHHTKLWEAWKNATNNIVTRMKHGVAAG